MRFAGYPDIRRNIKLTTSKTLSKRVLAASMNRN
jgi:hypothetical protein